jgi:hypothetical protein
MGLVFVPEEMVQQSSASAETNAVMVSLSNPSHASCVASRISLFNKLKAHGKRKEKVNGRRDKGES